MEVASYEDAWLRENDQTHRPSWNCTFYTVRIDLRLQLQLKVQLFLITPPEVTNTGPGVNRGSGGGARGCGFEERVGVHARTEGGHFL